MYQFESRVRYSEIDSQGQLSLEGILYYFQDCSTFQSEDLGIGISYLAQEKSAWVLSYWQIDVKRYPKMGEEIVIGTIPYEVKGFMGFRNFFMKTKGGEELACANSIWTFLDMQKGMPKKVSQELADRYGLSERYEMDYAPRKIVLPERLERQQAIEVKRHHLDTNLHVNNGQYIRMAMDVLENGKTITRLRAEYKKSALLGDILIPYTSQDETENRGLVSLCDETEKPYAIVEFTYDGKK